MFLSVNLACSQQNSLQPTVCISVVTFKSSSCIWSPTSLLWNREYESVWNKEDGLTVLCGCVISVNKRGREGGGFRCQIWERFLYPFCQAVCVLYAVWKPLRECVAAKLTQWTVISALLPGLGQQNRPALSHRQVQLLLPKERQQQREWKRRLKLQFNRNGDRFFSVLWQIRVKLIIDKENTLTWFNVSVVDWIEADLNLSLQKKLNKPV